MPGLESLVGRMIDLDAESCSVSGCPTPEDGVDVVVLDPLDPIDHEETYVALCDDHKAWAVERNEFAETVTEELRDARSKVARKHEGAIQRLRDPPDGEIDDAVSVSVTKKVREAIEMAVGVEE